MKSLKLEKAKLRHHLNRSYLTKWVIIGIAIGVVAGFGSTALYYMIEGVSTYLLTGLSGFVPPNPAGEAAAPAMINPNYFLIPVSTLIGGLIAGLIIYKFAPEAEGHGTDSAIDAFHHRGGVIRRRVPIVKAIASAFTIGSGGSSGREGPIAQIAAGFGSLIGDAFKLSAKDRRIALAAGIGAGIGSIFKSPFGGAILSAEVLYSGPDIETEVLIPAFIASPVGYVIFASFTGFTPIFGYVNFTFSHPTTLIVYALLGLICALAGRLYTFSFYSIKNLFKRFGVSNYVKPMIGGAIAGVIAIFFPEVVGLGYGFLQIPINGNLSAITTNFITLPLTLTLILLVLLKILATSFTIGSGGSGGVYAPALLIGGFLGTFLWVVINGAFPGLIPEPAPLVIIGMMALFAGVGRVPIAVILMVSEMTGNLQLLVPSMVAVVISYYLTGHKYTIYESQVLSRADSPAHRGEFNVPVMSRIKVATAMNYEVKPIQPEDTVEKAFDLMAAGTFSGVPVVNKEMKVVGILTMSDVLRVPKKDMKTMPAENIMTKNVITVTPENSLLEALNRMITHAVGRLPVVSAETKELVGILARRDLFKEYNKQCQELCKEE